MRRPPHRPVRRNRCRYCHALFDARNRRQQTCLKFLCQKRRRGDTNRANYQAHRYDRDFVREKRRRWQKENGRDYMRRYRRRKENQDYVQRNRTRQRERNRRRGQMIVKSDVGKPLRSGNLARMHVLETDCKVRLVRLVSL